MIQLKQSLNLSKSILSSSYKQQLLRTMVTSRAIIYTDHDLDPLQAIKFHKYELDEPKADQVIVQTLAHPINPSDLNQIQGVYPSKPEKVTDLLKTDVPSAVCGNEGAFKIIATGSNVTNFQVGDWCIPKSVNLGTWRSHMLDSADKFMKIPQTISLNQAATISVNPGTAYLMLTEYGQLKPGDWVIQNAGNSAVGKYVIQIAKKLGFNSISVVRDRDDIESLKKELYDLGATKVITDKENESKEFIGTFKEWTKDSRVGLALNAVGGASSSAIAAKLSPGGSIVTYGGMSMKPVQLSTAALIFKQIQAHGFWITDILKKAPESKYPLIETLVKMMEDGTLEDFEVSCKPVSLANTSDEEFLELYKQAIKDSKTKGKQLVCYKD